MKFLAMAAVVALGATTLSGCARQEPEVVYKPVLYLYPTQAQRLDIGFDFAGTVTSSYPQLAAAPGTDGHWQVEAGADGVLTDERGRSYPYLFWEGVPETAFTQPEGTVVAKEDVVPFLEQALAAQGLNDLEAADFITFWAPRLQANDYSLISFVTDQYAPMARYSFTDPAGEALAPDTFIRVYMVFSKASPSTSVPAQSFAPAPVRTGFTAVEWGGSELD
ncbi:MAG: hypothetical protein Q3999_03640 [Buchananella hordeovulneris]|nr:hypothetical protein [Buchananella hordeovulneris]